VNILITPDASTDIELAYRWYQDIQENTANRFVDDIDATFGKLVEYPRVHRELLLGCRHVRLMDFPYYIYYKIEGDKIVVFLIVHTSRNPRWIKRILRSRI
jgi:toxin ParE1/3/4